MSGPAAGPELGDIGAEEVERETERQLQRLREMDARPGESIGWLALNGLTTLGLLRACEQLGARFVPLNWRLGAGELAAIAEHAGLQHLLHDGHFAGLTRDTVARLPGGLPLAPLGVPLVPEV